MWCCRGTMKLDRLHKSLKKTTQEWSVALDLVLWCLQELPSCRPNNMKEVLAHRLFAESGNLHFLSSADETWESFMDHQTADLHAAIKEKDHAKVRNLFKGGGVHLNMAVKPESTVLPVHCAAFSGEPPVMKALLDQIPDEWPPEIKKVYLDVQTDGYSAYMIAYVLQVHWLNVLYSTIVVSMCSCGCGFVEISKMLIDKGCTTELINHFGKTGNKLTDAVLHEQLWAAVRCKQKHHFSLSSYSARARFRILTGRGIGVICSTLQPRMWSCISPCSDAHMTTTMCMLACESGTRSLPCST